MQVLDRIFFTLALKLLEASDVGGVWSHRRVDRLTGAGRIFGDDGEVGGGAHGSCRQHEQPELDFHGVQNAKTPL